MPHSFSRFYYCFFYEKLLEDLAWTVRSKPVLLTVCGGSATAGAGGIRAGVKGDKTVIDAYSGRRNVRKGDRLYYYFTVLVISAR